MKRPFPIWLVLGLTIFPVTVNFDSYPPEGDYRRLVRQAEEEILGGNYEQASEAFKHAIEISKKKARHDRMAFCFNRLGVIFWNLGRIPDSSRSFQSALINSKRGLPRGPDEKFAMVALRIHDLYGKGKALRSRGDYPGSLLNFEEAVKLAQSIRCQALEEKCLRQMSICYWERNQLNEFFTLNLKAKNIAVELKNRREESSCLNNLGLYYWKTNQYSLALDYWKRGLNLSEKAGFEENVSICLSNLALLFINIGNIENARDYLERALLIDVRLNNDESLLADYTNLGSLYRNYGIITTFNEYFKQALSYLDHAIKIARRIKDVRTEVKALNIKGNTYLAMEEYENALKYYELSYQEAKNKWEIEDSYSILINMGFCYLEMNDVFKAQNVFNCVASKRKDISNLQIIWETYYGLAQCLEIRGRYEEARNYYEKTIEVLDRLRSHIYIDEFKVGFIRSKQKVYEKYIGLLLKNAAENPRKDFTNRIFYFIEKAKARSFLECLAESKVDFNEHLDPEARREEARISIRISKLLKRIADPLTESPEREELKREANSEEEAYLSLVSNARVAHPDFAQIVRPDICTIQQIQQRLLDQDTILVEYFLAEPRSLMFVIDKTNIDLFMLPSAKEIQNSVKGYLRYLSTGKSLRFDKTRAALRIFDEILFPLNNKKYQERKKLLIVPHGVLYDLPFEALMKAGKSGKERFLIQEYEISYAPSSSVYRYLIERKEIEQESGGLLAFGDPQYIQQDAKNGDSRIHLPFLQEIYSESGFELHGLPYSREEIALISKYFPREKRMLFVGSKATENQIKKLNGRRFQIVHFACHGFLDMEKPMRSALLLSTKNEGGEDGLLQVRELYNLKLWTDLVILSACQTARGPIEFLEGVMGLPRIFFYSGARSVLSALWPIEDRSTAVFMDQYYRHLSEGKSLSQALQLTKLKMIESPFSHPRYWAPFVLNGDSGKRIKFES